MSSCPICFDFLLNKDSGQACCLPCGHLFHLPCLSDWFNSLPHRERHCPQCRCACSERQVIKLFFSDEKENNKNNRSAKYWKRQVEELSDTLENTEQQLQLSMQSSVELSKQLSNNVKEKDKQLRDSNKKVTDSVQQISQRMWEMDQSLRTLVGDNTMLIAQSRDILNQQNAFNKHIKNISSLKDVVRQLMDQSRAFQQTKNSFEALVNSANNQLLTSGNLLQDCKQQSKSCGDRLRTIEYKLGGLEWRLDRMSIKKEESSYSLFTIVSIVVGASILTYWLFSKPARKPNLGPVFRSNGPSTAAAVGQVCQAWFDPLLSI